MSDNEQTPKKKAVSFEQVLDVLRCGEVEEEHGVMRWSSNYTFLLSVVHEDTRIMTIYKPQRGERPLWDFPNGTLCYRELAAFLTSSELDWDIVPPTVLREGPHGLGSMQFYVDHDPELNYFSFDEALQPQLMRLSLFDYLVNNADRKGGHCLLDGAGRVWAIDHGITFHSANKLRTVIWDFAGQDIPEALIPDIERLCVKLEDSDSEYVQGMSKLLSEHELDAFRARVRMLLKRRRYPLPGAGPNYPWPPV